MSQNFGHEDVGTTMTIYGSLNNSQIQDVISGMSFSEGDDKSTDLLKEFESFLKKKSQGSF